jgi:hypothetical protein
MSFPAIIFAIVLLLCLLSRGPAIFFLFFASWSFGAFAAVPPELVGGVSLTPAWFCAGAMALKVALEEGVGETFATLVDPRRLGLLSLCAIYGVISAMFFPRLFAGVIDIIPMRLTLNHAPQPLLPTSANFTQAFYLVITVAVVAAFHMACRRPERRRAILNALLFGGAVAVITGLVDYAAGLTGASTLLAPFRTASYALMTNAEAFAGSGRRVVGLMTEASAFAALAIGFVAPLVLLRDAYRSTMTRNLLLPAVCLLLIVLVWLSKSSTGIVGVAILGLVMLAHMARSLWLQRAEAAPGLVLLYLAPLLVVAFLVLYPSVAEEAIHTIDVMVLKKSASESYIERSMWNRVTLDAFRQSWGLGAGIGSARASSWPIAVLGNIGVIGAATMALFIARILVARPPPGDILFDRQMIGAKYAILPGLIMGALAGTSVAFGLPVAWLMGMIGGMSAAVAPAPAHNRRARSRLVGLTVTSPGRPLRSGPRAERVES